MEIKRYESNGRYHNVICFQNIVFLSGQTGTEAGDDIVAQSQLVLDKIEKILEEHGSDKKNILHADVYVKSRELVGGFNAVWDQWIVKGFEPTRACMVAELGREPILVEVVVIAAIA